jgi:hypothetical protein
MPDLLHHVRVLVALYDNDMEALPGGDNDPVPAWDDVMRELRKAIAEIGACRLSEAADTSGLREALANTRTHAVSITDYRDGTFTECLDAVAVRAALRGATTTPETEG